MHVQYTISGYIIHVASYTTNAVCTLVLQSIFALGANYIINA